MTDQSTVSVNMTWTGNLNLLGACLTCGNDEARTTAREELRRMAAQADKYVASQENTASPRRGRSETIRRVS